MSRGILFLITMALVPVACISPNLETTPGKVLETYVRISFEATGLQDKMKMEELLTGDTRERLHAWSDEEFEKTFLHSGRKFQGLKILDTKRIHDREMALTYELSFDEGPLDRPARVTQKKLCTVVKEEQGWRIKEVRSLRESIEFEKGLVGW
jgi:hypothetical protein